MDLLNTLQKKTRELTFNKTGNEDLAEASQEGLLMFAVNQAKKKHPNIVSLTE